MSANPVELVERLDDGTLRRVGNVVEVSTIVGPVTITDLQTAADTPTISNVTMTLADTEYSQVLPANTKRFSLQCQTNFDIRFAFEAGRVAVPTAPYGLVRAGMNYFEEDLSLVAATLYFASSEAAQVAEVVSWV